MLLAIPCLLFLASRAQDANRESIVLSNDGILFATTYESGAVEVYDIATGKRMFEIKGAKKYEYSIRTRSLSFSPDNKYLAIAPGWNAPTSVMDIATGKLVTTVELGDKAIFTGTGKLVTIKEKQMNIYSSNGFTKEKSITLPDIVSDDANPCTVDATSDKIIVPLFYSDYVIIDAATGDVVTSHKEETKEKIASIQVSMDASSVITCTKSLLKIFSIKTDALRFKLPIESLGFTIPKACLTERNMLYTGSLDGENVRCININTGLVSDRESIVFGPSSGSKRGFYFAPRSGMCAISYAKPYKKKAPFAFMNVITRESPRTYLE